MLYASLNLCKSVIAKVYCDAFGLNWKLTPGVTAFPGSLGVGMVNGRLVTYAPFASLIVGVAAAEPSV